MLAPAAGPGDRGHQRPDRRRARPVVAVGRALRAARRAAGGGQRRAVARPVRAAALRRGRAPPRSPDPVDADRRPGARARSTSPPTTPRSRRARRPAAGSIVADVAVALVYPDLLGTYGDGGNARDPGPAAAVAGDRGRGRRGPPRRPVPRDRASSTCSAGARTARRRWPPAELRADGRAGARRSTAGPPCSPCAPGCRSSGTGSSTADGLCEGVGLLDVETVRGLPVAGGRGARGRPRPGARPAPARRATRTTPARPGSGPGAAAARRGRRAAWATAAGDGGPRVRRRAGARHLPARPGPGPQPRAGRPAAGLGGGRAAAARAAGGRRRGRGAYAPSGWRPGRRRRAPLAARPAVAGRVTTWGRSRRGPSPSSPRSRGSRPRRRAPRSPTAAGRAGSGSPRPAGWSS